MNRDYYAIYDADPTISGAVKIRPEDAAERNNQGFGIFWTVNDFGNERRLKENLKRINSWFIELDDLPKSTQLELIDTGLIPSLIVESKRGYHVYFDARDATPYSYTQIMKRLVEYYGSDPRARDICRILRAPGFKHVKEKEDPFEVHVVWQYPVTYTERQMLWFYPPTEEEQHGKNALPQAHKPKLQSTSGNDFWEKIYNLDCEEGLKRLSGTGYVNGEHYSFKPVSGGKLNILVNNKSTSCFIDADKRIGSSNKGGPTLVMWLRWFGMSTGDATAAIKSLFPEVFK